MAQQFSITDQKRISFLSLLSSAVAASGGSDVDVYAQATEWLEGMEADGFFEEAPASRPTSQRSGTSRPQGSNGRSSNSGSRGRDQRGDGGFKGFRDPNAPATEKQVAAALKLGAEYSEDELFDFTMQEISDLMSDLRGS